MNRENTKQVLLLLAMAAFLVVLFSAGYYFGRHLPGQEIITNGTTVQTLEGETTEELVARTTEYVIETYDLDSDELTTRQETVPVELIGFSRSDVIDYITSHKEQFQEKGEEVQNISMISFSGDQLVLRKDVTESVESSESVRSVETDIVYNYYLVLEDGVLVVYKKDKTTIFLETGIEVENLDETERVRLTQGIGITNISELYRYLEGYTS